MPNLKHVYAGTPHRRVILAKHFKAVGVQDQEKVEFTPDNGHTAEVSATAAKWLTENEPGDWEIVDATSDGASSNEQGSGGDDDETLDLSGEGITPRPKRRSS